MLRISPALVEHTYRKQTCHVSRFCLETPGFHYIPSSFPVFVSFSPVFFEFLSNTFFSLTPHFLPSQHWILSKFSGIASVVGILPLSKYKFVNLYFKNLITPLVPSTFIRIRVIVSFSVFSCRIYMRMKNS